LPPDIEVVDHRTLGTWSMRGAEGLLQSLRGWSDLADDVTRRADDILALRADALLARWNHLGIDRTSGGAYERPFLLLWTLGADGLLTHWELFDPEREAEALARFDALTAALPTAPRFENAATRAAERLRDAWSSRDLERYAAVFAPAFRQFDRRKLVQLELDREQWLAFARMIFDRISSPLELELLATRGDRLALGRVRIEAADESVGPSVIESVNVFEVDERGQHVRMVRFDPDDLAAAYAELDARFDGLVAALPAAPARRRVRENGATAHHARLAAAIAARDADALPGLLADDFEAVNHAMGATVDREGPLLAWRRALQAEGAKLTREPLAALGDSLALDRQVWSSRGYAGDTYDIGPVVFEALYLTEVNARGQARRSEAFAADKLGDAIVRLYERHAELLPEGPERARSTATARSIATRISHLDVFFATFAPDVEAVDHRVLGTWSARGMAPLREQFRSLLDLTEDLALRFDDVLGLRNDAHLVRATNSGQLRAGGGTYERTFLMLRQTNADGLFRRVEWFDPEREAEALARFDALTAAPTAPQIENAATRSIARFEAALEARDWPGIAAGAAPDFRQIDRRGLVQLDLDRDQHLEWLRVGLERPSWRSESEVLATRGDRLALGRVRSVESDQSVGPSENEWLALVELNERGQRSAIVMFDPGDLDAAYAELDARYDAGEAAAHPGTRNLVRRFAAAIAARDWAQLAAVMAPDFVQVDHRPPGLLSSLSRDEWVASVRALAELRPDVTLRGEHVLALDDQGFLVVSRWLGRESEGAFETPVVVVGECGGGAIRQWHGYELDQLDAARARFAAIRAGASRDPLAALARPNAASAALDRLQAGFAERDWAGVRALAAPGARFEDRRRHARTSGDVDWWLSDLRQIAGAEAGSLRYARKLVVTAGERVCLERVLWAGGPAGGRVEIEYLWLAEVDAAGRLAAGIAFDLEDRRAASREARARWMARDALAAEVLRTAVEFTEAMNDRDAARLRASFADDLVVHDRRRTGMGVIEGADAYLDSIRALWELAPESVWDSPFHLALEPHGRVHVVEISGTLADGGRFERWLVGIWITTGERIARIELFELEDASAALARFAELRPGTQAPRAARTVRPNAASRNAAQLVAAVRARDAAAVPGLFSDDFEAVDHSTGASYGHTGAVDTTRMLLEHRDLVFRQDPLATLGDQLALCLNRQTSSGVVRGAMDVGATELETLLVAEVDERGRRRRNERFRADRLADAIVRLYERHAELLPEGPERTREAATARTVATLEGPLDAERYATTLAPDAELRDWRSLGLWTARGREAAVRAFQTMLELVGSFEVRIAEILDLRADALLLRCNNTGTLREGGGAYERSFILLLRFAADGLVAQSEVFESERDTEALARFDALAAQPPPRFENAATRAMEQTMEAWRTRDWQRIEARIPEGFQLLDRRKLVQLELDRDGAIEYLRSTFGLAPRIDIAVLATRGERLALARVLGEMGAGDVGASEIESLMLYEMDARGARKALIRFDLDDLDAAYAELDARFDAGEAAACPRARATMRATTRAWLDRDWDATLRLCAPDFAFCDHRLLGWGTTIRDAAGWMQTQQVLVELAPDVRIRFDHVRIGARGFLRQAHQQGTRDGGAFEMQWLIVRELDDLGRILRNDYYDLDRIDEAFARFAELSRPAPDPQRIPPNAATRARELQQRAREAGDQDDFAARLAPGMLFDDRRRGIRLTGDRDTFLASARVVATARTEHTLLATAGERLAVYRARWHQPGAEAPFEVEMLQLWESDARGRIAALIIFDPGDRRAAFRELAERHARSEEGAALPEPVHELRLALLDGDLERARAVFPPDFAVHDHRRNRLWRIEGRDAWIAWMATLFEQSPDAIMAARCYLAVEPHGCLLLGYSGGTLAEGGEFEQEFLSLWRFRGGRLVGLEMFEVEDLERARARLEELRPGPGE
jgi:ketosteroid isomerase-like protein